MLKEKEKLIYNLCCRRKIDFARIDYLLKNGADANAKGEDGLLLFACLRDWASEREEYDEDGNVVIYSDYYYNIIKIFIDNDLCVDECIDEIFFILKFTNAVDCYIDITKLLLNNLKDKKLKKEQVLEGINCEINYNIFYKKNADSLMDMYKVIQKYN